MKLFISFDMEGVAGIVDWAQCGPPGQAYEEGRALLLGEVNAAIDGALTAGATEIVCNDSHGAMNNLNPADLHGRSVYSAGIFQASQVYGLAGEAMLNFSPIFAPLAFFFLAFVVVNSRSLMLADPDDLRWLLVPILANAMIILPAADVDNQLMFFLTVAACPLLLLRASCVVVPRQQPCAAPASQITQ